MIWLRRRDIIVAQYDAFTPFVSEKVPTPIDKDAGLFFSAIEQSQVHTQPGQPGQVSRHGAACRQLNNCRPAPHLGHHTFIEILEWLRLLAVEQAFDRFTDMASGLERSGAEPWQYLTGFAVGHGCDVADGEDPRMVFELQVRANRNAPSMHEFHTERADDRIGLESGSPNRCVCLDCRPGR